MANVSIRLRSDDWFYITGRGAVATFAKRQWPFDPADLRNQKVIIDGKCFTVTSIERFAVEWHPDSTPSVGLLVRAEDDTVALTGGFSGSKGPNSYTSVMQKAGKLPLTCDRQTEWRGCDRLYDHKGAHHDPDSNIEWT